MKHVPGLDGLRALAVIAVVLFHAEYSWASGGFLGVSLFFTLSGFLITSLLLAEHDADGAISLRRFYGRRARRLLPAAYVCLLAVALVGAWWSVGQQRALATDLLASVANVANWRFALSSTSYQDLFLAEPSPVAHFWSLAIEEQIYLLLPVVVVLALRRGRRTLAISTAVLFVASLAATMLTSDRDLVYNGTHTRAAELLVGVALAQWFHQRRPEGRSRSSAALATVAGASAGAGLAVLVIVASLDQGWIYGGGLPLVSVLSAILIASVAAGRFPARLVSVRPLVAVGTVSYGIYLYHWPVFLLLDEARVGVDGVLLLAVRGAVTAILTIASYRLIEQPVRLRAVFDRDRAMAPAMALGAFAVAAAAIVIVPTASTTPSQELLTMGEQGVVEFAPSGVAGGAGAGPAADEPGAVTGRSTRDSMGDGGGPAGPDLGERGTPDRVAAPMAANVTPSRVAVIGTDPAPVDALRKLDLDVVDGVRTDCPLSSVSVAGCDALAHQVQQIVDASAPDVFVITTGGVELRAALAEKDAAQTDAELVALGASQDTAIAAILAAIDVARASGAEVVWYTAVHPISVFYRHFLAISVMRPDIHTVDGPIHELIDAVPALVDSPGGEPTAGADRALRVLVIGDSTSIYMAQALSNGSDGRLDVLWAGANGCPFAPVDGVRGQPGSEWRAVDCEPYTEKVPPLVASFDPDVLFVMSGPMELHEQRPTGESAGTVAGDGAFEAVRDRALDGLLAAVGPDLPVLFADLPAIRPGRFSSPEMSSPERLAAVNAQLEQWAATRSQVAVFAYREAIETIEAQRGSVRADGAHPDIEPLEELARATYVDQLLAQVDTLRARLGAA